MYGRETKSSKTAQIAPTPTPSVAKSSPASSSSANDQGALWLPIAIIVAVALYFVWALLEQHQKIKTALEPKAIGLNFRNIAVIIVTVVLGLNLFKVGAVKFSVLLSRLTGGRLRARWLVYLAGGA